MDYSKIGLKLNLKRLSMKKQNLFMAIILVNLLLISCGCPLNLGEQSIMPARKKFINSILENPDNIISIIDNSLYYSSRQRTYFITDDSLKSYISYIKKLTTNGYRYVFYSSVPSTNESTISNEIIYIDEIKIKGNDNNLFINFYFWTENNKWILHSIDRWLKNTFERYEEFPGNP